jgi:hypothetical protein
MRLWYRNACLHAVKRSHAQGRKLATWLAPSPFRLICRLEISAAALAVFCHQFGAGG